MKQNLNEVNKVVIHCSATTPDMDIGFKEIDQWHKDRGWDGCGYHIIIRRDGSAEKGRDLNIVGAHVYGHNKNSIAIVWVGGIDVFGDIWDNRTPEQRKTLRTLVNILKDILPNPNLEIVGHRDLSPDIDGDGLIEPWEWLKECPSFDVKTEL